MKWRSNISNRFLCIKSAASSNNLSIGHMIRIGSWILLDQIYIKESPFGLFFVVELLTGFQHGSNEQTHTLDICHCSAIQSLVLAIHPGYRGGCAYSRHINNNNTHVHFIDIYSTQREQRAENKKKQTNVEKRMRKRIWARKKKGSKTEGPVRASHNREGGISYFFYITQIKISKSRAFVCTSSYAAQERENISSRSPLVDPYNSPLQMVCPLYPRETEQGGRGGHGDVCSLSPFNLVTRALCSNHKNGLTTGDGQLPSTIIYFFCWSPRLLIIRQSKDLSFSCHRQKMDVDRRGPALQSSEGHSMPSTNSNGNHQNGDGGGDISFSKFHRVLNK